ncbi:MAG: OmpA family protein [Devosia sp.]|uniref:OmpA family protein n=1 Tax=Devosia sp. TaxID=1871048 RepID=UPI0026395813|nr:OmpA family protein [Devosia sp.]MDB5531231.1 OmpA family protein [Devosia sp.]
MIKLVVKWVAPGLMMVLGGAALAATMSGANAASDSDARTIAAPATLELAQAGSIVTVQSPLISDYWMSATRQSGGVIVFDGYAPDEATRKRLSETKDADTNFLKLGRGAPENYQAAVDFGLAILARLSEGRFALDGESITLTGIARSSEDYTALAELIAAGSPQGLLLARNEIQAPPAMPYLLSAAKTAGGSVALTGMLPNVAAKASLAVAEGNPSVAAITYASGEPDDLIVSATTALGLLKWLDTGTAAFNGTNWTVSGTAATAADKTAIEAAFTTRRLAASGWTLDVGVAAANPPPKTKPPVNASEPVAEPEPTKPTAPPVEATPVEPTAPVQPLAPGVTPEATEPAPPVAAPEAPKPPVTEPVAAKVDPAYAFTADRGVGGAVTLSGQLPADPALRFFGVITGAPTTGVTITDGAPDDFILNAEAGIRALMELDNGQLRFAIGKWSLSGKAQTNAARDAVMASVAALPAGAAWTLNITAPPPLDGCQASVAEFSTRNAILFQSGAAVLAPESSVPLDELAGYLALCPAADVDVEGHTDADGDDQLNLALSVARAEAVIDALIARKIAPERLYAVGYGESQPIADNDTTAGKRLNRRIVIKVLEHHVD